jgi:hypothetical protein
MTPVMERRPGETAPLSDMPPDPGEDQAHAACSSCYPHPRDGDQLAALCGFVDTFHGWGGPRGQLPDCPACLAVIQGRVARPCGHPRPLRRTW